jgi:hypothetical protein
MPPPSPRDAVRVAPDASSTMAPAEGQRSGARAV